jgi:CO dehydrogenase/acetyl-CoA synthase delta subunit
MSLDRYFSEFTSSSRLSRQKKNNNKTTWARKCISKYGVSLMVCNCQTLNLAVDLRLVETNITNSCRTPRSIQEVLSAASRPIIYPCFNTEKENPGLIFARGVAIYKIDRLLIHNPRMNQNLSFMNWLANICQPQTMDKEWRLISLIRCDCI